MIRNFLLLGVSLLLFACTGVRDHPAPTKTDYADAQVPGYSAIRFWGDREPPGIDDEFALIRSQVAARAKAERGLPNDGVIDILVLSGGGSDGAYGAGLLNGWSARGGRPEFALVTGISTGALIAPYAFLGSDYDNELERFYTNTQTDDLLEFTILRALLGKTLGLSDTGRLAATLDAAIDEELVVRLAEEHAKGRRLWVGTTNLDAQRPVIWDIGEIASSGRADARRLIRDVLLASAAIPGAFPPQQITVELDGQTFTEMHVDGGVTRQLFLYPVQLDLAEETRGGQDMRQGTIHVVRNTKLDPDFRSTRASIVDIAARSISTLIKAAGVADVLIIESQARKDGFGLKTTSVPADFSVPERELFDPVYMRALYESGYRRAFDGDPWKVVVPAPGEP